MKRNRFCGELQLLIDKAQRGNACDVDFILSNLTSISTLAKTRYVDYALSIVNNDEGIKRIKFYLFKGSLIQRNYCSLYFNRKGDWPIVKQAYEMGLIDEVQAYAR